MNKKKIIAIIGVLIGITLIVSGIIFTNSSNDKEEKNNPNIEDNDSKKDDTSNNNDNGNDNKSEEYNEVYEMVVALYGGNGKTVELKEEAEKYIIYVKNSSGKVLNTFDMDKKTGVISEQPFEEVTSSSSN